MQQNDLDKLTCNVHKIAITDVCVHPLCSLFQPLCSICLKTHKEFHEKNKLISEPEPKNVIQPIKELRQRVYQSLVKARHDLEQLQDAIFQEISLISDPDSQIDIIINELQSIKVTINKEFDSFIENLRIQFETPIKEKMNLINDEIKQKLDQIMQFLTQTDNIDTLRIFSQNDIPYQVYYQKTRMDQLINQRKQQRFSGTIDDDVSLRFIGSFQKELNNLIVYKNNKSDVRGSCMGNGANYNQLGISEKPDQSNSQQQSSTSKKQKDKIKKSIYLDQIIVSQIENQRFSQSVFYFEPKTKNFYHCSLQNSKSNFEKIQLNINFVIPENHRSVLSGDGNIYLLGGYPPHQVNEQNEDQFKVIYQLDADKQTLIQLQNFSMISLRHSFGVCQVDGEIFVVGGANYREGALVKCEKINCKDKRVLPINSLIKRASHCCLVAFKGKYLFKFGGIQYDSQQQRQLCNSVLEHYTLDTDIWAEVQTYDNTMSALFQQFYLGGGIQINQNQVYIFGGCNEAGKLLTQTCLVEMKEDKDDFTEKNIFNIYHNSEQLNYPGLCLEQAVFINNKIYQIFYYEDRPLLWSFKKTWTVIQ